MVDTGLAGRTVLVTGGAGGIGAAISRAFAHEGARVVLVNNAAHCESPDTIDTLTADGLERHYRVNAVAPGPVQTGWMTDDLVDQVRQIVPLGRPGDPEDIADAVVFLASHQARWITGQVLQVAGGHAL
ncbi:MAG: SDR family oxidoreductase [Actinomycetota bacterium]|nr:SDR family oxidoreductase [Actinomycetota bacterium]